MKKYLFPLLIIIISQCVGCAITTAWLEKKEYVENVIAGRVKVDEPAIDLTGEWEIRTLHAVTQSVYEPDQDNRGTIILKPIGNGWTGEMDTIDVNYRNNRTIQKVDVVLSGDKLTIFGKGVIFTDWTSFIPDVFTGKWNSDKQEFSGGSIYGAVFMMKRSQ